MAAESSAWETADGITVLVDLQDAAYRTKICRLIADIPGLVLAAPSDEAEVVVTDVVPAHDKARERLICMPRLDATPRASDDAGAFGDAGDEVLGGQSLSARERQALALMADGHSNKEIARRLGISVHTAKFHVASVIAKLRATSRTEAVALALRQGLLHL